MFNGVQPDSRECPRFAGRTTTVSSGRQSAHAWGDAPIYDKVVTERGDVPSQVNADAARILAEAERTSHFKAQLPLLRG
jgi:hypothetical protein